MAKQRKTYFLVQGFENTPSSAVKLGDILSDPTLPDRPLSSSGSSTSPPDSSVSSLASSATSVDAALIRRTFLDDFSFTLSDKASTKLGLWAQFLQIIGLGGEGSVSFGDDDAQSYAFERMETASFDPPLAFVETALRRAAVQDYVRDYGTGRPLYMVTSVKTVTGATVSTSSNRSHGVGGRIGVDLTAVGAPVTVGPEVEVERGHGREVSWHCDGPLAFAFQVRRIRLRRGKLRVTDHNKGAVLGQQEDEALEDVEVDSVEDLAVLDEDEAEDAIDELEEDVRVLHAVDEGDNDPILIIAPAKDDE